MHGKIKEGTFAALCRSYKASAKFQGFEEATRDGWGRELDFAERVLGPLTLTELCPRIISEYLDGWADKPGKQRAALSAFKNMEKWATVKGYIPPGQVLTYGVEIDYEAEGYIPWTDNQIALAERHAAPHLARAIVLGAWTGQRGSDLVRMGWSDITVFEGHEGIEIVTKKVKLPIWIPILPELAERMATWERQPGPFLRNARGGIMKREDLSNGWGDERDRNPALAPLKGLCIHGLRAHTCVRLYRWGMTTREVSQVVGLSLPMVERYCRKSVQKENATAAIIRVSAERWGAKSLKVNNPS